MALAMAVVRRAFCVRRTAASPVCASWGAQICAGRYTDCALAATTATTTSATLRSTDLNWTPPGALETGQRLEGKEQACQSSCQSGTITRIAPGAPAARI